MGCSTPSKEVNNKTTIWREKGVYRICNNYIFSYRERSNSLHTEKIPLIFTPEVTICDQISWLNILTRRLKTINNLN